QRPVRILTRGRTTNTERVVAAVGPLPRSEVDQHSVVGVDVLEPGRLHWIQSRRMRVLLTRINARATRVAGSHVENQRWFEKVSPPTAVVPSLRSSTGRPDISDRGEH